MQTIIPLILALSSLGGIAAVQADCVDLPVGYACAEAGPSGVDVDVYVAVNATQIEASRDCLEAPAGYACAEAGPSGFDVEVYVEV